MAISLVTNNFYEAKNCQKHWRFIHMTTTRRQPMTRLQCKKMIRVHVLVELYSHHAAFSDPLGTLCLLLQVLLMRKECNVIRHMAYLG